MRPWRTLVVVATLASALGAASLDQQITASLLRQGAGLSAEGAAGLEERLKKSPREDGARIQLLSYYASPKARAGGKAAAVKAARARHIFWLINNDPANILGMANVVTGVYRLHCKGDELADPENAQRAGELWRQKARNDPKNLQLRRQAIEALQSCSAVAAEEFAIELNDRAWLGTLYAAAILGISDRSYLNNDPAGSDPELRKDSFAAKARVILEATKDKDLLVPAALTLLGQGATLWADGKLDWDYTAFGANVLARAKAAAPEAMVLMTLPTKLPERSQRPPMTVQIPADVQKTFLIRKVPPSSSGGAKQGTVRLSAVISPAGKVVHVYPESGPKELVADAAAAVKQWEYNPVRVAGKACYVITAIDVTFEAR